MRKEIVAVTNQAGDLVRHDGAWYRKVARKGRSRDLVLQVVGERVYKIAARRDYGSVIYEGGGWDYDDCYRVLEPLDTSATGDYHEHESMLYRKERRKAQVGELVLVVDLRESDGMYGIGDTLVVASRWAHIGDGVISKDEKFLYDTEYVVLVPIAHAALMPKDEPAVSTPEPPTIAYHDEFATATRESVYEVWARGKAAMARKEIEDLEARLEAVHEKASEQDYVAAEDADLMSDYCEQAASLHRQVAHWRREESKYTELADAAAAKIKERKVA